MDKDLLFFLVTESRIVGFSSEPDDETIMQCAREAILFGDRNLRIVEVEVAIGLPESQDYGDTSVILRSSYDIQLNPELLDAFEESKMRAQQLVWDSMPAGIYRVSKDSDDKASMIEYCPDIGEDNWQKVEAMGWNKQ